jgi:asparagine N-glycosylation enzyme membrane subunit Stt3
MPINGVDIDQYILLIFYPSIVFFTIGYITKKRNIKRSITYLVQAIVCFVFSIAYYLFIPQGGAFGLALILGLFGILLLILARKEKINPEEEEKEEEEEKNEQKNNGSSG